MKIRIKQKMALILCVSILFSISISASATTMRGDINMDNAVNTKDDLMIRKYLSDIAVTGFDATAADCDGDGKISMKDDLKIQKYIAGSSVQFAKLPGSATSVDAAKATQTKRAKKDWPWEQNNRDILKLTQNFSSTHNWIYNSLSDMEKTVYKYCINTLINDFGSNNTGITIKVPSTVSLSAQQTRNVWAAVKLANPGLFWLNWYGFDKKDSKSIYFQYQFDKATRQDYKSKINASVSNVLNNHITTTAEFDMEEQINDWICLNSAYDGYCPVASCCVSALVDDVYYNDEHKKDMPFNPICSGYAGTFALLCQAVGIECTSSYGFVSKANGLYSGLHEWNIVKINGFYHKIDVCWNDDANSLVVGNDWFNLTDSAFVNHYVDANGITALWEDKKTSSTWQSVRVCSNLSYPICNNVTDNYYRHKGLYASTQDEITLTLARALYNERYLKSYKQVVIQYNPSAINNSINYKNAFYNNDGYSQKVRALCSTLFGVNVAAPDDVTFDSCNHTITYTYNN